MKINQKPLILFAVHDTTTQTVFNSTIANNEKNSISLFFYPLNDNHSSLAGDLYLEREGVTTSEEEEGYYMEDVKTWFNLQKRYICQAISIELK